MNLVTLDQLRKLNLNVIPLKTGSKEPAIEWKEYQEKLYPGPISNEQNIGIVCGKTSQNLVVIDIDFQNKTVIEKILPGALEKTLVVKTGKDGTHIYLKVTKLPKTMRLESDLGRIDIQ